MKKLLVIIFTIIGAQISYAQSTNIPPTVKTAFEGIWQYTVKYETNTVKISVDLVYLLAINCYQSNQIE